MLDGHSQHSLLIQRIVLSLRLFVQHDLIPEVEILEAALDASRRVNSFGTAVRILEGVREKVWQVLTTTRTGATLGCLICFGNTAASFRAYLLINGAITTELLTAMSTIAG